MILMGCLKGRNVAIIEMGHTHSTVVIVRVVKSDVPASSTTTFASSSSKSEQEIVVPLAVVTTPSTGAVHFDLCLFDHLAKITETKHGCKVNYSVIKM